MKLNKYFMIGAMGLSLVACSDNLDENGQGVNSSQEGTTYVGITLKFADNVSRVGETPVPPSYTTEGENNEDAIDRVTIVITNQSDIVEYKQEYQRNSDDDKYVFSITPGIKKFYAYANQDVVATVGSAWTGTETVTKTADELAPYQQEIDKEDDKWTEFFAMSSTKVETQTMDDGVSKEDAEKGLGNNVSLTVERMVAKVTVKLADDLVSGTPFNEEPLTIQSITAQIGNANNTQYTAPTGSGVGSYNSSIPTYLIAQESNNVRVTPTSSYNYGVSSAEGFWNGLDVTKLLSQTQDLYDSDADGTTLKKNPTTRFYCLENTHPSNYVEGNTTFLYMQAVMIPKELVTVSYTAATTEPVAEESITFSSKTETVSTPKTFYYIKKDPNNELTGAYILAEDLAKIYSSIVTDGKETETDKQAAAVVTELEKDGRDYVFSGAYTDGVGNFPIPVNDLKDNEGGYTNINPVFRNDWYDLTITGINFPGAPTIDPDDPFGPDPFHPETYGVYTITLRQWNKVVYDKVELE